MPIRVNQKLKTDSKRMSFFKWLKPFKKGHSFRTSLYIETYVCNNFVLKPKNLSDYDVKGFESHI